jgi:hypothetical protein
MLRDMHVNPLLFRYSLEAHSPKVGKDVPLLAFYPELRLRHGYYPRRPHVEWVVLGGVFRVDPRQREGDHRQRQPSGEDGGVGLDHLFVRGQSNLGMEGAILCRVPFKALISKEGK